MSESKVALNDEIRFNLKTELELILSDAYLKYVKYSSKVLIQNLLDKFNLRKFFLFLQSYFLFKSNEIMFLFSKSLFEMIKQYETYQDDAILNKLLYKSTNAVFTTDVLAKSTVFSSNLVTVHYDSENRGLMVNQINQALTESNNKAANSRLICGIRVKVNVIWPLNIVIRQANLDTYNRVFSFMMQLKQIKYDLDNLSLKGYKILSNKKTKISFKRPTFV
jgi:hypothetical protein